MKPLDLAIIIHGSTREPVERHLLVQHDEPASGFVEWNDLTEEVQQARVIQAEYLLDSLLIVAKDELGAQFVISSAPSSTTPILAPPGLIEGRSAHYVDSDGGHSAALIVKSPGTLLQANRERLAAAPDELTAQIAGLVDLIVFPRIDTGGARHDSMGGHPFITRVNGVIYDPEAKAPNTWHFIEKT
jgi:hypothetical protein